MSTGSVADEIDEVTYPLVDEMMQLGPDIEAYRKLLARMDTDPEYLAALVGEWDAHYSEQGIGNCSEDEVRYMLGTLIKACDAWPMLRSQLEAKNATFEPQEHSGETPWAQFRCFECRKSMYLWVFAGESGTGTFDMFCFEHVENELCDKTDEIGRSAFLEWLGLGAFTDDAGLDLSFLDDGGGQGREPDWLIPGMFARGDYWSLFGPSEVGKSLLALDWSVQMARRGERVLYLDRENPKEVLEKRFLKMRVRREDFVNLLYKPFVDIKDLATPAGAAELRAMVDKHGATVVILDTISKFSEVGQAVQSDRWQKIYNNSFVPLLRAGVSIGQLDHTGLGDKTRERDSNAKRDNVSVAWALTWRGDDRLTLTRAKNRPNYSSPGSIAVERRDEPVLTHVFGESVPDDIRRALEELERLNLPARAGRPAARAALDAAGVSMADKVLEQAIRLRKTA